MTAPLFAHETDNAAARAIEAIEESGYPETTFISFDKPMSPAAERTVRLLIQRYGDDEGRALVKTETESLVTLRIPRIVRRKTTGAV